jgi:hypothetical protein
VRLEVLDRFGQVFDADRDVMKAFAVFGQVAAYASFARFGRRDELDFLAAQLKGRPLEPFGFARAQVAQRLAAQDVDKQPPGRLQVVDADRDVIESR